jgi:hypothetical protein
MTRTQFLSLFAIPFLPKVDLSEKGKPVFDVERLQKRIDYLKKYPLTEREAFPYKTMGIMIPQGEGRFMMIKEGGEVEVVSLRWKSDTRSEVICKKV